MDRTVSIKWLGMWLALGAIAAGACALQWPAAHLGSEPLPVGNDSFYHARRILDTVADPAAFYQFDPRIHAPEGSLLTWPWGYDYVMAWLVNAVLAVGADGPPIRVLIWIPVAAVFASVGLMLLIARRLCLSPGLAALAGLAVALSPLTQALHGVGQIDHHYAEYIFVLATIGLGLRWFQQPHDVRVAIALGIVLGAAAAVHNGLFILQLPVLAMMATLWAQKMSLPLRAVSWFSAALLVTTLLVLLPSLPFQQGRFEFYTLSWFHLYVAAGTAAATVAFAALANTRRNLVLAGAIGTALLVPLVGQLAAARTFVAGTLEGLDVIAEMRSLPRMAATAPGRNDLTLLYSLLVWLAPFAAGFSAWRAWRERRSPRLFFWICCIAGLALLVAQLRLHYFGSFALYLPWLVLAQESIARWPARSTLITLGATCALVIAYWIPTRYQLTEIVAPSGDAGFRALRPVLASLRDACAREPGIVLADVDAGHYIRYYTDCSVIADNFLLTPQHVMKLEQVRYLTSQSAQVLLQIAPAIRYVLLRPVMMNVGDGVAPLTAELLQSEAAPAAGYVLLQQVNIRKDGQQRSVPYVRLYFLPRAPAPHQ
jgi:hypothetical protein